MTHAIFLFIEIHDICCMHDIYIVLCLVVAKFENTFLSKENKLMMNDLIMNKQSWLFIALGYDLASCPLHGVIAVS